jgi:hypothetical protein
MAAVLANLAASTDPEMRIHAVPILPRPVENRGVRPWQNGRRQSGSIFPELTLGECAFERDCGIAVEVAACLCLNAFGGNQVQAMAASAFINPSPD